MTNTSGAFATIIWLTAPDPEASPYDVARVPSFDPPIYPVERSAPPVVLRHLLLSRCPFSPTPRVVFSLRFFLCRGAAFPCNIKTTT